MKHIIIGNGVAGTTAALNIRRTDPSASISIITDEMYPFYSRIRLPQMLAGETDEAGLVIHKPDWYAGNRIDLFLSTSVSAVDPVQKKVFTSSREEYPYDRLLLSTGAHCFVPPVSGSDRKGVFTLRSISDAREISDYLKNSPRRVLLIGGGVLGIEAGFGLMKAGCSITVVEVFTRLIPKQLDTAGAALLQSRLETMGFSFHLGMTVKEIQGTDNALSATLSDNRNIDCDLI
ncbi:MAG: NAD(P)/FAD-dependent oxidoreductase, partial [Nitrospirae bacterium]|nr:NAD(P)/FAD-dependent oxidoreductase [Nitrospirota bacterium]